MACTNMDSKLLIPMCEMLMDAADEDGSGTLSLKEFVTIYIEFDELKEALIDDNLGPNNEKFIEDIIFDADLDKDSRISYDEFRAMMKMVMDWKMASRQ
ncbi:calcium-dependent protein kinase 24-like [Eucalyptus grandis]|uniref:calcium-dependent protein kinase 24-like n=1 Tax=Eucalyptus grandis TaxID=71139 RepID=UPI00192E9DBA|nr:calcium-dependent protein kinase 24-like [Eucalyptus grandis]